MTRSSAAFPALSPLPPGGDEGSSVLTSTGFGGRIGDGRVGSGSAAAPSPMNRMFSHPAQASTAGSTAGSCHSKCMKVTATTSVSHPSMRLRVKPHQAFSSRVSDGAHFHADGLLPSLPLPVTPVFSVFFRRLPLTRPAGPFAGERACPVHLSCRKCVRNAAKFFRFFSKLMGGTGGNQVPGRFSQRACEEPQL
jgi:hypothetical protein